MHHRTDLRPSSIVKRVQASWGTNPPTAVTGTAPTTEHFTYSH